MSLLVVGSARSSGATTLAMALAASLDHAVLVEADPDGGVLALRYRLAREPGLMSLAAARDLDAESVFDHAQRLAGGLAVVPGPEAPERATHLLRTAGGRLARMLAGVEGVDLVLDAGRLSPSSPALCFIPVATTTVVVARPCPEDLVAAADRVAALSTTGAEIGLVLVGSGPYSPAEVSAQLGCVVIGTIADDARTARTLAEGGRAKALSRSALVRSAASLASHLKATSRPALHPQPRQEAVV